MAGYTAITVSTKSNKASTRIAFALAYLMPLAAQAADLGGGIRVGVSHTDNVLLRTSPNEIDDFVYQASPFFTIAHESPNVDASLNYIIDWYRYDDQKNTNTYHRGTASLTAKGWQEALALELGARRSQTLGDPEGVLPSGTLPLSNNLIDQDDWWINPRFNKAIGRTISIHAGYRYTKVQFDEILRQDNDNHEAAFALQNYRAKQGMTWAIRYTWRRTEYEFSAPWEHQQANLELGFWVNERIRVFGSGGKESAWDRPFDPAMDDTFWEVGFAHEAGEKLSAEFAAGERSFGSSLRGRLDYTFKRGNTSLSYIESPSTTGFNRSSGLRLPLEQDGLDDFLDDPGSAERFLSKRLQWNINVDLRRTVMTLAMFSEDRSGRVDAVGSPLDDQKQAGVRLGLSLQVGKRTNFGMYGLIIDQETGSTSESRYNGAGMDIKYDLGSRSSLSLIYNHSEQQPEGQNMFAPDWVANVVSLLFLYTF